MPELPSRIAARYYCLISAGLLPSTAAALCLAIALVRAIPALIVVALGGAGLAALGARAVGIGLAVAAAAVLVVGLLALIAASIWSDAEQGWRSGVRGQTFTALYSRGWAFQQTLWSGVRGSDRLYQRRLGYRQLDLAG